jgi:hypothetical protein
MLWLFVISSLMIVVGAAFSILRNPQTLDYCRTMVNDGRKDDYAKNVVVMYNAGLAVLIAGAVLLIVLVAVALLK